ncbi:alpha/beta hydrolase [Roseateles koreensis]|uniref:Alpha/beta hydrolase n=1 Tax=Roseateles koreensis TaxID=2987526 RepID=A0ABT5KLV1_9BURK|nr:alpha/beta hydrolase [Roseateles koreensis]MDC8783826.1 alpha/beta hydrolase [Roseateles koreensis]
MQVRSSAWFDAQYNNRARVEDSAVILERMASASKFVRENAARAFDLPYGPTPSERLDVFPTDVAGAPVLVVLHGGWWRGRDKSDYSFLASAFTEEGAMVVVPNYPLCPEVSLDRIPLQLTQALAWVWRNAARYGGDPNRIIIAGHSAGGHLAAMLTCCDWKAVGADLPRHLIKGAISISGVHDLAPIRKTPFLQADLRLDAAAVRRLSPVHFPAPEAPFYAVVGAQESEEFKRQTQAIRQAWGSRAVPVCEEIAGCNHFDILHDLADPQGRSHLLTRRLLALRWFSALF